MHSLQVFGSSPDETAFFRILLNRERAGEAMLMIQPSLVSYSVDQGPEPSPVLLDVQSILPDRCTSLGVQLSEGTVCTGMPAVCTGVPASVSRVMYCPVSCRRCTLSCVTRNAARHAEGQL